MRILNSIEETGRLQYLPESFFRTLRQIFRFEIEVDRKQAMESVSSGIYIRGVRVWFLLASCLIASIGLNTNSSAVIIGAMLISPLMGPILGLGFGLATASRHMIRVSIQNLVFAILISLSVAALYFLISPFQDPTSEILARTAPNLLDLLVAVAAAFAGVVAMNSPGLAGVVPGVAIATAIMPPLCVCAYGLSQGNWKAALGAFYLFFVNAFAIAVVAFLLFKRLKYTDDSLVGRKGAKVRPAVISIVVLLIIAPLGWSLWDASRDNFLQRSISRLVQSYKSKLEVVSWQWDGSRSKKLVLYNFKKASPALRTEVENALRDIVPQASLELHESAMSHDMEDLVLKMKTSQFSGLVSNPRVIEGLIRLAKAEHPPEDLMEIVLNVERELAVLTGVQGSVRGYLRAGKDASEIIFLIQTKSKLEQDRVRRDQPHFQQWLKEKFPAIATARIEVLL